ncbi:MAG: TIGR03915 family putative DNA repair protein, partial [Rubrivivax sp.]
MRSCVLAAEADLAGFRAAARVLLRDGIEPSGVGWSVRDAAVAPLAFGDADTALGQASANPDAQADRDPDAGPDAAARRVPADFVALCRDVVLHRDPQRFARLYRLLWRLCHEPSLRHDPLDAEMALARRMAQAVRRDIHKMRAFVRFRPVDEPGHDTPLHVAWFEPQHHIVETNAPFFERRFAGMRWAILTPERSVRWDGRALQFGPGGARVDAPPADAGEALWLTYYRSIFNPARLKLRALENEMPRRYWRNLPEAVLIAPLAAEAHARRAAMIEAPATVPRRRIVRLAPAPRSTAADAALPVDERGAAWEAERDRASHCRECPIGEHATQTVWGEGPIGARVMLVGEQPGD